MGNKDGFLVYAAILCVIVAVIGMLTSVVVTIALEVVIVGLSGVIIAKSWEHPIKLYSPIPWKLDRWRFIFYVTEGSELISPEDLLLRKLK